MMWPRKRVLSLVVLAGLALGLLVSLVLVRSDPAGLETAAGTVDQKTASAFLSIADTDWRNDIEAAAGAGGVSRQVQNLPPDARCYFVTADSTSGGKQSLHLMACGPVRRLGVAEGAVWDIARIEGTSNGNQTGETGQTGLRIVDSDPWQRSVRRPADGDLFRPDDKECPDGADQLAAPPAPAASPRLVQVHAQPEPHGQVGGVGAQLGKVKLAEHNEPLIAPDVTVTLTGLGTADTIGVGAHTRVPAAGERFVVARFTTAKTSDPVAGPVSEPARDSISGQIGRSDVETSFGVAADGQSHPIDLVTTNNTGTPGSMDWRGLPGGGYLVASVPTDAKDVSLTATTQGVTQSLSLLTSERTSTNVAAAYYRPTRSVTLNQRLPVKTVKIGRDFDTTYTIAITKVGLTAWDPEKGWAPPGQAWLRFRYDETWDPPSALYEVTWNSRFFTATADGRPITLPTDYNTYTRILTAAVPADVKTIRITVTARFTFIEKSGINYAQPKSGTADFGTLTAGATFG